MDGSPIMKRPKDDILYLNVGSDMQYGFAVIICLRRGSAPNPLPFIMGWQEGKQGR